MVIRPYIDFPFFAKTETMASKFFSFLHSKKEKSLAPVCRAVPYMSKEALLADKDESELMLVDYKRADRIQSARQLWLNWLCTLCLLLLALQAAASIAVVSMWTRNVCNEQKCAKVTSAWCKTFAFATWGV